MATYSATEAALADAVIDQICVLRLIQRDDQL
jgi:hypothetical protein